jgi:2-phosphoglycerate kinase
MNDTDTSLDRILWIGGGTDAGKTTTATLLAEKLGFQVYHYDRSSGAAEQLGREKAPRMFEWIEMSIDECWQLRNPEEIARHTFETFDETFSVKLAEILAMTKASVVIAEGFAFTPKLIEPLITSSNQAIWLIPTEEFQRDSFQRRGKDRYSQRDGNSDPELATRNHFKRDLLMAEQVRVEAEARGLRWLRIDGSLSLNEVALVVEEHFASYLNEENSPYDTH